MNSEGCKCIKQVDSFHTVSISAVVYTLQNASILCRKFLPTSMQFASVLEISTLLPFSPRVHMCSRDKVFGLSVSLFVCPPLFGLCVFKGSLYTKQVVKAKKIACRWSRRKMLVLTRG